MINGFLFAYERLLPCTIEVKLASTMTVRIPCPEIQAIAKRVLSRLDRARAIENIVLKKRCSIRVNRYLLTVSHRIHYVAGPPGFEPGISGSGGRRPVLARLRAHCSFSSLIVCLCFMVLCFCFRWWVCLGVWVCFCIYRSF